MQMNIEAVATAVLKMQSRHVLVVGDVMLDQFIDGEVTRISPEAPVPVLSKTHSKQMPGGAANVACNLAHLGCRITLIGMIGNDQTATTLKAEIERSSGIAFTPLVVAERPTIVKTRFRAGGQQILRVDDEDTAPLDGAFENQLLELVFGTLEMADVVVISDYAKGCLSPQAITKIISAAKKAGKTVIADPKHSDFSIYAGVDVLTPNLGELRRAAGHQLDSLDDIASTAANMAVENEINAIMATLSARGILLVTADGTRIHEPALARDIFDVSGAGDTVVAMLAAALASGIDLATASSLANLAAGVAVSKSGTAIVSPGEVLAQIEPPTPPTDMPYWQAKCTEWREAGLRIGFANGCFDLLHPGHIFLLSDAAQRCDKLIIGLNSDASVQRLKGPTRPLQSAEMRAAVLASMPQVAGVAIFDEDTPLNLITALQPDILVKGGDYEADQVVGGDVVRARGGAVIITPTFGSHSSSKIASR